MMSKAETRSKEAAERLNMPKRTDGVLFASVFYLVAGLYYIIFPTITQDFTALHLYTIGLFSIITGYLLLKVNKEGLWLGLLIFPAHIVTPAFGFEAEFNAVGAPSNPLDILFLASLIVLIFFASVTFLVLLDQRANFNPAVSPTTNSGAESKK